jgi:hypothetical protein
MHGDTIEAPARPARRWSKQLWALVAFVTTVLTAAISWVVTTFADRAQQVRDMGDGATASGPLMLWDARTDAVSEAWDARTGVASAAGDGRTGVAGAARPCVDCMVRGVWPRPGSAEILIEVAAGNGDDQTFWTATLAP